MTATVQETPTNNKRQYVAVVTTNNSADVAVVNVDGLAEVTITVRRSAGAGSDTLAVTGGSDGTNFGAVVSTTQVATGGDTALTAVTSAATVNHAIRQKVRFLKFTSSGTTDTWEIIVTGVRN